MQIRRLTVGEYEAITNLWKRARLPFKPHGRDSRKSIAKEMAAEPEFFLGAYEQDQLIGVAIVSSDMRKGWINRLAVDPEHRSQGVARALITESERILKARGVRVFCALIEADNSSSKELFEKCGYTESQDIAYFSKRDNTEA
jgi:ribosomal protein S18 acetylase RimI-like enzyme